jgi:short-subunit dehydrogenase
VSNNNKYNILVTGCSAGLGAHLSKKFESEGHRVLQHAGRKHHDLSTYAGVLSLAEEAKGQQINCLVNNAAIVCPNINFTDYSPELIKDMISVNLAAPILLTYFLLTSLEKVVNINSMVGLEIKSPRTLYSSTKWGLRGFSNSLKKESSKLSILDVYPTNIKTTPDRKNAMDVDMVVDKIYNSFVLGEAELILDGRK